MKFVPITLKENANEIHTYLQRCNSGLLSKIGSVNHLHWSALKYAASLIEPAGDSVIEIGCGEGYLMPTLSKYFNKVVGVDASEKMFNSAKLNFSFPNTTYLLGDITSPKHSELTIEKYNWVVCLEVLEHIGRWEVALNNMIALLRSEGRGLLSMPVEIGLPLLVKEVGRIAFYRRGSDWEWIHFIKKFFGSSHLMLRNNYGSHMGFAYREVIHFLCKISSINIECISFFPVNFKYLGFRVYVLFQKRDKHNRN